jgi:nitric oxide dioxygenase
MTAVTAAVDGLGNLDQLAPFLVKLGARHARYGVRPEHFAIGGEALLWTLEQGLGDLFTREVREAWEAAWGVIADAMISGIEEAAAALEPAGAAP